VVDALRLAVLLVLLAAAGCCLAFERGRCDLGPEVPVVETAPAPAPAPVPDQDHQSNNDLDKRKGNYSVANRL